jgi:hypothetical protein
VGSHGHREQETEEAHDNRDDRQDHRISNVFDTWSIPVWANGRECSTLPVGAMAISIFHEVGRVGACEHAEGQAG